MSTATKKSLEKVAEEFSKEVTAELEEGRAQALESLERVGRETTEAVAKIIEAGNKQAESLMRQITGSAELRSRNLQLRAIEEAVGEVFDMAMAKVAKASPAEHEKAITHLLTEGVEFIGPEARVDCNASDKKVVSAVIKKLNHDSSKLTLGDEDVSTIGGVVLTSPDGTVKFDNTFEARLERLKPMLRREVAGLLAGGEAQLPVKGKVGEGDYTGELKNGKVAMPPHESMVSPTSTIPGPAAEIPIKEPVDEETQKSAAGRIRRKREGT